MSDPFSAAAASYDRFVGRYSAQLAVAFVDFAAPPEGARVLDVGAGPGGLSAVLVQRLGAEQVSAVEPSESFAAAFRERLAGVELHLAGAESLPFEDAAFDGVLSQLVVNFIPDPEAGVREMLRVTRPGGVVAACVWDYAGAMTLLRAFWDAVADIDPAGAAAVDEGSTMPFCTADGLASLWRRSGAEEVRTGGLVVQASYTGFDDAWAPIPTGVGPAGAYCAGLAPERQEALRDAFQQRLGVGDEPFALSARAWVVAGVA